nr:MAG TPA: hypothetical protein [Caudoviricetes sp.]
MAIHGIEPLIFLQRNLQDYCLKLILSFTNKTFYKNTLFGDTEGNRTPQLQYNNK